ncbi:hypothetical protein VPH35_132874 [Triticum aestivum]
MESLAEETLRQILLKLPTRDLARCICRLYGAPSSATPPSAGSTPGLPTSSPFRRGDPAHHDTVIHNVSSAKLMCRITDLSGSYAPTNACNGLLCLTSYYYSPEWPIYVCNPVTGDKLAVPPPPNINGAISYRICGMYAMGFSPLTHQYKLFRLSALPCPMRAATTWTSRPHCTYHLPEEFTWPISGAVHAFEMRGKLCVSIHVAGQRIIRFWVMPPLQGIGVPFIWEHCYTYYMDDDGSDDDKHRGAWLDDSDPMLCYRLGDILYMYDTTKDDQLAQGYFLKNWNHQIQLPAVQRSTSQQWNVYGGYRPSLVSPRLIFAPGPNSLTQHRDEQEHFAHSLLYALRCQKSLKK